MTHEHMRILQDHVNAMFARLVPGYTTPRAQAEAAGFAKPEREYEPLIDIAHPIGTGDWNDLGYSDLPVDSGIVDWYQPEAAPPSSEIFTEVCLKPFLEQTERDIKALAALATWDMSKVKIVSHEPREYDFRRVQWDDPSPLTIELRRVSIEAMEIFFGGGLIPLCERPIPAEGTE